MSICIVTSNYGKCKKLFYFHRISVILSVEKNNAKYNNTCTCTKYYYACQTQCPQLFLHINKPHPFLNYVGKRDGVAFQGGSDTNAPLKIGSGSFIPGFEEGLIGVMPKSTVDLNLTFPESSTK